MSSIGLFLLVFFGNAIWVGTTALLASRSGMLTPSQMMSAYPTYRQGLPFLYHGGVSWGDLLIFGGIMANAIGRHYDDMDWSDFPLLLLIGFAMSCAMHWVYAKTDFPDSIAWVGGRYMGLTPAGIMHFVYMTIGFAVVGMFLFSTRNVSTGEYLYICALLALHVAVGNHLVLGVLNEVHHWSWCPEFLRKPDPYVTVGATCVALMVIVGIRAGITSAAILGLVFFLMAGAGFAVARQYLLVHGNNLLA